MHTPRHVIPQMPDHISKDELANDLTEGQLLSLWSSKQRILQVIEELVKHQLKCIEDDNIDGLLDILAHKQGLILQLRDVDGAIQRLRGKTVGEAGDSRHAEHPLYRDIIEQCRTLLKTIIEAEQKCEAQLKLRRDAVLRELAQLRDVADAHSAYVNNEVSSGYRLDLSS